MYHVAYINIIINIIFEYHILILKYLYIYKYIHFSSLSSRLFCFDVDVKGSYGYAHA